MKKLITIALSLLLGAYAGNCMAATQASSNKVVVTKKELKDKIRGGWAGKTIGCTYGGPVEFLYNGTMIQDYVPIVWNKDRVKFYFDTFPGLYDDLYVEIVFVRAFEKMGLSAPADSIAAAFTQAGFPLWHANQMAKYNVLQGIKPPMSGHWLNNPHADDIDYQIEADFAGLMTPGMPNTSADYSDRVGHIFTYGDGWYGGVFVGALYSMALVCDDMEVVVKEALKTIPEQSKFYQCIHDVVTWYEENPLDWKKTWFECEKKWASEVGCPDGVFIPLDIDAKINSAYVVMGLLYGEKDFYKSLDISTRCGQDADCNAATVGGVLGAMLGYEQIPEKWKESLYEVEDLSFAYTDVSLNQLTELSFRHALCLIKEQGGKLRKDEVVIKTQKPKAVKYEKSFAGHYPSDRFNINVYLKEKHCFDFKGNGFTLKGYVSSQDSNYVARAEMYIDHVLVETVNLPVSLPNVIDNRRPTPFFKYQLDDKKHVVELRWLNPREDTGFYLGEVITYSSSESKLSY